jgi:hypothetical protein
MAQSSNFYIIRATDTYIKETDLTKVKEFYLDPVFNPKELFPPYLIYKINDNDFSDPTGLIEFSTSKVWDILFPAHFISSFAFFAESLGLNPGNNLKSQMEISTITANEMLTAIKYILSRKYSFEFEMILNNRWVSIFKQAIFDYESPNDYPTEETLDGLHMLNRVKLVLETFITLVESTDYNIRLIFMCSC